MHDATTRPDTPNPSPADIHAALKRIFGHDRFRTYGGEPLQEKAVLAALAGESLLAVFPTGGGKSITFQLPALMAWERDRSLTLVISPLQSLMKDQVDNLAARNIHAAVTINGLLSPVERAHAISCVEKGSAALLYVSPEQLRSGALRRLLLRRRLARLVVDEAHCFAVWGHDFRVDYLLIADFLRDLRQAQHQSDPIPVSCFTATAKRPVIDEVRSYFQTQLGLDLRLFRASVERSNLTYHVRACADDNEKYVALRDLLHAKQCPAIVYVCRTKRAEKLAARLKGDAIDAYAFHGRMDPATKIEHQDAFLRGDIRVMVATSAFGMGVDKKDVGLVVHHDIAPSLEDYLQEAGRAGRDPALSAECWILYNPRDLNDHFSLLSHSAITGEQINKVWQAVRRRTRIEPTLSCSAFELALACGWHPSPRTRTSDLETRVTVALAALEASHHLRRETNAPIAFASGLNETDLPRALQALRESPRLSSAESETCRRIISLLIAAHEERRTEDGEDPVSQIDQIADRLMLSRREVIHHIGLLRDEGLLTDATDMSATFPADTEEAKALASLNRLGRLESLLLDRLSEKSVTLSLKELNAAALKASRTETGVHAILLILNALAQRQNILMEETGDGEMI